ncbi:flippase [Cyanobium sp. ATX 6A2]|uniref:flippase n=1 Tax=Cyanobium sp. ATX 6A2 TaxID=2823700 RepID=UPI0020CC5367|nr:flippase [Cyanobium sp. ATX 6A2]MCP9887000.1 flippase [Cyanobium sp. ATX 6A2]
MAVGQPQAKPERLRTSLISQVGSQVFRLAVSIGIGGWTARYLGPEKLGTLSYVAALVGVLSPLGSLGVKGSLAILLCEEPPRPGLVATAFWIELLGTAVIALVLVPFAWAARDPVLAGLMGLAVLGNLFSSAEVFEVELLNRQQGTRVAKAGLAQTIAGACVSVVALLSQAPLMAFGGVQTLAMAARAVVLSRFANSYRFVTTLHEVSWPTARVLLKRGWPLLLAGLSVMLYVKSDQVMLEWLRGPEEVGQYSVAVKTAESLYFLPVILSATFLPRIGHGRGNFDTDTALKRLYKAAWILGVGMALVTSTALSALIPLIFGPRFQPAQNAMIWLGLASFAVSTGTASSSWLQKAGLEKVSAARTAAGCSANILLNLALIPSYGFHGAAIATFVSYGLATFAVMALWSEETRANALKLAFPFQLVGQKAR